MLEFENTYYNSEERIYCNHVKTFVKDHLVWTLQVAGKEDGVTAFQMDIKVIIRTTLVHSWQLSCFSSREHVLPLNQQPVANPIAVDAFLW